MSAPELAQSVFAELPFVANREQCLLVTALSAFVEESEPRRVFVLNGYAGTGKTSVVGALVKALKKRKRKTVILAPTGRAAKVAQRFASQPASTIHKRLYRGNSTDPSVTSFFLARNTDRDTIFIVDEASLITDSGGNASLLRNLVNHIYSSPGCRMILVGDIAQLPPVGQPDSPAMNPERLKALGLAPSAFTLEKPARQQADSGILYNAHEIRRHIDELKTDHKGFRLRVSGFPDVEAISSAELADYLSDSYSSVGMEETLIVTRSNKRANNFNRAIRNMVLGAEDPIVSGDRLIIAKNDYYWSRVNGLGTFLANGDSAEVSWVGKPEKAYGRYFQNVELRLPDSDATFGAKIMLRSLVAEGPSVPRAEMERFYALVMSAAEGELSEKISFADNDPFFNALQVKYAYCVTCHKAQGGQWRHIYIDMGAIPTDAIDSSFFRWLYTAVTRATEKVFFINPTVRVC